MQNDLLSIFKAITPDNIKDIPLIEDSMRIFIELLNENSPISADIKTMLSENTTTLIEEELHKIYLYDYYSMIENIKANKNIITKFRKWNDLLHPQLYPIGMPIIGERLIINYFTIGEEGQGLSADDNPSNGIDLYPLSTKLNELRNDLLRNKAENYYINRIFKQSKGLLKGINFIYDIMNEYLVNESERKSITIEETGNPFELNISGSVDKDIYVESVAYLAHPLGFVYNYLFISDLYFEDIYSVAKYYDVKTLEVRCLSGNIEQYTKKVSNIIQRENYIKIVFEDGFYLVQNNDTVNYFDNTDFLVKTYPPNNHCSIFIDYELIYKNVLTDELTSKLIKSSEDTYPELDESYNSTISTEFDFKFIIGQSVIGEDIISRDTDYLGIELIDEEFSISIF